MQIFFSPSCPKFLWGFLLLHMALEPIKIEKAKKTALFEILRADSKFRALVLKSLSPWNILHVCPKRIIIQELQVTSLKMKIISFRLELLTFELWIHPYIVHQGRFRMLLSCQLSIQSALLLRQPKMYQVFCWWCWGKTTKIFFIHEKQGFSRILRKIAPIFDDVSQGFPNKHRLDS